MSFASWYSVSKNLPDADVIIECASDRLFAWVDGAGVKWNESYENALVIPAHVMAVRELTKEAVLELEERPKLSEVVMCLAQEDRIVPFISYETGCGAFVTATWINREDHPFPWAERFMTQSSTTNEVRALRLWRQAGPIYKQLREVNHEAI